MKWFSFLAVVFTIFYLTFPSVAVTASKKPVVIKSISHRTESPAKETITFALDGSVIPNIFILRGEKPRLVIDFPQSVYLGKNVIALGDGNLASTIRIGAHQTPVKKTRAVIDLSPKTSAQYATEYVPRENTLIVTLTPDAVHLHAKAGPKQPSESQGAVPVQKKRSGKPLDKKADPPDFSVKKAAKELAGENAATPVAPMILEISFDDSSSKGDMVRFRLNDFYPPIVSAIEKEVPQVVCDFMTMNLAPLVQKTILADGKYVQRIDTTMHHDPEKVRVILELSPGRDYDLQQVYYKNDTLFVLMVNGLVPAQDAQ